MLRFLTVVTGLGLVWGLLETHLYLYLNNLGISKQNIGLGQSLATLTGLRKYSRVVMTFSKFLSAEIPSLHSLMHKEGVGTDLS